MQYALVSQATITDPIDFAFRCAAVDFQMREHFWPAWHQHLPYAEPRPCVDYRSTAPLNPLQYHPIFERDRLDVEAAGYHAGGYVHGLVLPPSDPLDATTPSHEALEMATDEQCDQWRPTDADDELALEVCDPVEADAYAVAVTIAGETRQVLVSNFVLPAYFSHEGGLGPFDHMKRLVTPFSMTPGGYQVRRRADGTVEDVFAGHPHAGLDRLLRARVRAKRANPHSRTARRHARP